MTTQLARARRAALPAAGVVRRTPRAAVLALALAAACADAATALDVREPDPVLTFFTAEEFEASPTGWSAETHAMGRGRVHAENVAMGGGVAALSLAAGAYDGAEIISAARHGPGAYAARMRTPRAPGSISAFFLYQGVPGGNDEIDIEIFNDGTRRIMFTTWVAGLQTHTATHTLPFDPADAHHDYAIEWSAKRVRFLVDGVVMQELTRGIPQSPMFVMANTWWPTWLSGPALSAPDTFEIDRIQVGG